MEPLIETTIQKLRGVMNEVSSWEIIETGNTPWNSDIKDATYLLNEAIWKLVYIRDMDRKHNILGD